jgi:hypothetical protein
VDVKDASGSTVAWRLEMITPNALKRNGTTRQDFTANIGKEMNARACPAKVGGDSRGAAEYIKLADGILRIVGQIPERGMTPDKLNSEELRDETDSWSCRGPCLLRAGAAARAARVRPGRPAWISTARGSRAGRQAAGQDRRRFRQGEDSGARRRDAAYGRWTS